jgi:hypothetical protein
MLHAIQSVIWLFGMTIICGFVSYSADQSYNSFRSARQRGPT